MIMGPMRMSVMSMTKGGNTNKIDHKPKTADSKQLSDSLHLATFC